MNTHSGDRPYKCPVEKCPFDTPNPGSLTRHRIEQHAYVPPTRTKSSDDQESEGVPEPATNLPLHLFIPLRPSSTILHGRGSQTGHSSNVITHFAQVVPQSQSPSGSSSWDPSLPSLLLADEHVALVGHSYFASTASQAPMTQHPMPEQGYSYAMVPAAPLFPTVDRSATEEAWNESYAATPSVSMPMTSYGAGNSLVSAPTTLPPYSVRNAGILTPAAIPRYGNQYHVGDMPPPASMSSTSSGNQYNVGSMLPPTSTSSTSYGAQYPINYASDGLYGHAVGNMLPPASTSSSTSYGAQYPINYASDGFYGLPPASTSSTSYGNQSNVGNMLPSASTSSSTSYGAQYPINYGSDGFYGHTVGNMLPPAPTSSTSYGTQYPTNHTSYGNHGHTANAMSFGAQITHQQTNGSFANPDMNGYSQATYPQAGGQGYLHTTHAGTSGFRRNGFSPY
ncbi:hypothetical protein EV363DRAFT_1549655 [Boletus edulis]|nr:hypothetical protein EV363DRAFT_1549655 [Boletus edulis]